MKKMNTLFTAIALTITMVTPVTSSAATVSLPNGSDMIVSKTYDSSYTVTIPSGVDNLSNGQEFTVSATSFIEFGSILNVSVTSGNDWTLKDKDHTDNKAGAGYKMKIGDTALKNNDVILSLPHTEKSDSVILTADDIQTPTYAGTYIDTLTFTVSVD